MCWGGGEDCSSARVPHSGISLPADSRVDAQPQVRGADRTVGEWKWLTGEEEQSTSEDVPQVRGPVYRELVPK